jgi:hypothetical protein
MRSVIVLLLCVVCAFAAGAANRKMVGSFNAQDGDTLAAVTPQVWAEPTGTLTLLNTPYAYSLTGKERDALVSLIRKAADYMQVAKDNSTTIQYGKEVGRITTEDSVLFVVYFFTESGEKSTGEVRIFNGGRNSILVLDGKGADDMVKSLSAAADPGAEYSRQVALFR